MYQGKYVFTQLCEFLPKSSFDYLVDKYEGNKYIKSFTCWNHLLVLIFGQLTYRESLRDLVSTLNAHQEKFHHLGFGKSVTRSNLSKANEIRSVEIFEDFTRKVIAIARQKKAEVADFFIENDLYAFDSSTISFCLKPFWWAYPYNEGKGGIKLHTLYDVKRQIPVLNMITDYSVSDCTMMGYIPYVSNSFYVFDKAYVSCPQLYDINSLNAFFVVRKKRNMVYSLIQDRHYNNKETGVMADQIVEFTSRIAKKGYPKAIRCVTYYSPEQKNTYVFLTNNMELKAEEIALIYKYRWNIEVFFKWIKQHLRIKEFYGTSENAVKIQIYSAIIAYCIVAIAEKESQLKISTYEVLRILSVGLLEKKPFRELFEKAEAGCQIDTQLSINFF
ncbi:IS4 family transposase [Parabacteroides segnis]|uniref:IS4 family transposase n=1 Tax=Parabacteroides segnis TaxID=2763058 RepID=UPI0035180EC7